LVPEEEDGDSTLSHDNHDAAAAKLYSPVACTMTMTIRVRATSRITISTMTRVTWRSMDALEPTPKG
jgi:hypothetical protein